VGENDIFVLHIKLHYKIHKYSNNILTAESHASCIKLIFASGDVYSLLYIIMGVFGLGRGFG